MSIKLVTLNIQAKVLRIMQEQEFERLGGNRTIKVDVRLIASTNKDLASAIERGEFREDLFYRLNVVNIHIPPLRERREDILPLAEFFVRKYSHQFGKAYKKFDRQAAHYMMEQYPWPGNIRELENAVERAVLLSEGERITQADLALPLQPPARSTAADPIFCDLPSPALSVLNKDIRLKEMERRLILEALERTNWVQKEAAKLLGISRRTINYKIQVHRICHPGWRKNRWKMKIQNEETKEKPLKTDAFQRR